MLSASSAADAELILALLFVIFFIVSYQRSDASAFFAAFSSVTVSSLPSAFLLPSPSTVVLLKLLVTNSIVTSNVLHLSPIPDLSHPLPPAVPFLAALLP